MKHNEQKNENGSTLNSGVPEMSSDDAHNAGNEDPASEAGTVSLADYEKVLRESQEQRDKYMRAAAEMENVRRRLEREKSDSLRYASENLMKDLVPVLDSLDKALGEGASADASSKGESILFGLGMVRKQLLGVLTKHGLEEVKASGAIFDPNVHQAIQRIESASVSKETVQQEFAKGYILNGRLLRPSMVSVAVPSESN